ncbi:MAG: hypothetical protein AAFY51_11550 [Pseudomonadota bacterium]
MMLKVVLLLSCLLSFATAYVAASLLDYNLIEPYVYAITYFEPSDPSGIVLIGILYSPAAVLALIISRSRIGR